MLQDIHKTKEYQNWKQNQVKNNNQILNEEELYSFYIKNKPFFWVVKEEIYIDNENRVKDNEFIVSRSDICSCVIYCKETNEIVLVKEFRSPVNNGTNYIYELPGGSSFSEKDNINIIISELQEEIGLIVGEDRLQYISSRQLMGTLAIHKCHLYKLELTMEEMNALKANTHNKTFGVKEDTELTYVEIVDLSFILQNNLLDYSNIGMIYEAISK